MWNRFLIWLGIREETSVVTHVTHGDVRKELNIEGTETGRLSHTEPHVEQVERKQKQMKSRSRKK